MRIKLRGSNCIFGLFWNDDFNDLNKVLRIKMIYADDSCFIPYYERDRNYCPYYGIIKKDLLGNNFCTSNPYADDSCVYNLLIICSSFSNLWCSQYSYISWFFKDKLSSKIIFLNIHWRYA